ncbi:MAG: CHAD domain-containing protein [Gammaproteobacteria bacterium]|nr:CHAD domain-containing protein [Gammaproteobacteria bacterium]
MNTQNRQFQLPAELEAQTIIERISAQLPLGKRIEERDLLTYYDSFDWRLFGSGMELIVRRQGRKRTLQLRSQNDGGLIESLTAGTRMPVFCRDLPAGGGMRRALDGVLQMRALMPQVELRSRITTLPVLDDEEKTVARIAFERHAAREPGKGKFRDVPGRLLLLPIRGYEESFERLIGILLEAYALPPGNEGLLAAALAAIGRIAGGYSSKLDFSFQPEQPAASVAREIQLQLLATLELNLDGTKANLDSEFLHDLRVAVRRARSALTQIKGVFPATDVERFKPELAWIGQITGESRDMDVYLLDYDRYRTSLPQRLRPDLDPLHDFLQAHQKSAYRKMVRQLNSERFRRLLADWRDYLQSTSTGSDDAPAALASIAQVANKRIYRIYKRVLAEGSLINADSPAEALHELRKNCKKLRYLIEFFQSLYPKSDVQPMIRAMKQLLDNLGLFQDLEVQAEKLRHFAHQMVAEGEVPVDTLLAMGMLVDGLLRRQAEVRLDFGSSFAEFSGSENRKAFKALFAGKTEAA